MRRWGWQVALSVMTFWIGCASRNADWFRIYDARAELEALRSGQYADVVQDEVSEAKALLSQAEHALNADRFDDVAELSELVLLRVEYARAVARKKLAEQDAENAETLLESVSKAAETQSERLRQAQEERTALEQEASNVSSPAP